MTVNAHVFERENVETCFNELAAGDERVVEELPDEHRFLFDAMTYKIYKEENTTGFEDFISKIKIIVFANKSQGYFK